MDEVLIKLLKEYLIDGSNYLSGDKLGSEMHVSRAAISKHISALRNKGFEIESVPHKGHRLISLPDNRLIPEWIHVLYKDKLPFQIFYKSKIGSTNSYAKQKLVENPNESFIILTDEQIAGRGRYDRVWQSEAGKDLIFSIVLKTEDDVNRFFHYMILISVALFKVFQDWGDQFKIKWPNDIYYSEKKICGILSEMMTEQNSMKYLIIGVGINVNSQPHLDETSDSTTKKVISLSKITRDKLDRNKLMVRIIEVFYHNLLLYKNGNLDKIYSIWKNNLLRLGQQITIKTISHHYRGILKDIHSDGAVIMDIEGEEKIFYTGDLLLNN